MASNNYGIKTLAGLLLFVVMLLVAMAVFSILCTEPADAQIHQKVTTRGGTVSPVKLEITIRDLYERLRAMERQWLGVQTGSVEIDSLIEQDTVYLTYKYEDSTYAVAITPIYESAVDYPMDNGANLVIAAEKTDSSFIVRRGVTDIRQEYNWIAIGTLAEDQ